MTTAMTTLSDASRALIREVVMSIDREKQYIGTRIPEQGEFIAPALLMDPRIERFVGFCVQVRRKTGAFGSDQVFLRHADGTLVVHENQAFCRLTAEQVERLRPAYDPDSLPDTEDYTHGYEYRGVTEVGYVIENSPTPASAVPPMRLLVRDADGNPVSDTVILD